MCIITWSYRILKEFFANIDPYVVVSSLIWNLNRTKNGKCEWRLVKKPVVDVPKSQVSAADLAFLLVRQNHEPKPSWTTFNERVSEVDHPKTIIGYMPIIQAPAHELSTLNTVVRRVIHVAEALNQTKVGLTIDQPLFPSLMELKWVVPEYRNVLIPRLGGLHVSMNFLKILGQHMTDSGLVQVILVWVESGLLGVNSAEHAMDGKSYAKGIRTHSASSLADIASHACLVSGYQRSRLE